MITFNLEEEKQREVGASLKVIGIGGGGGNAVNSMMNSDDLTVVEFVVANTDIQALSLSPAKSKIQIGSKITKGLGAGSNPDIGRRSAEEDLDTVLSKIADSDILFLTAGLGGGTGSGALPVIAQAAKEAGILTVVVVTKPFLFEGRKRKRNSDEAIEVLKDIVDTLIIVPNQKLIELADPKISMLDAFAMSNDVLKQAIKGISDIITKPGHINVDFADARSVMKDMGMALMGTGRCSGEGRAREAALKAISSPLLENVSIDGAKGVLINITGNNDLGLHEINEVATVVYDLVSEDANIIIGSVIDPDMGDDITVTVIATGFDAAEKNTKAFRTGTISSDKKEEKVESQFAPKEDNVSEKTDCTLNEPVKHDMGVRFVEQANELSESVKDLSSSSFDLDDIDTPTFLRKKAEKEQDNQF
mgnify:CR=1 FL=1